MALDAQRDDSVGHRRGQALLAVWELLRLGHSIQDVSKSLRLIRHVSLADTARYLCDVLKILAMSPVSPHELPLFLQQFQRPWIMAHFCMGMLPGHV